MNPCKSVFALLIVLFVSACEKSPHYPVVGTLERDRIALSAELSEPISAIHVREGDSVSVGQRLIEQDPNRAQSVLAQREAAAERARKRLDELLRGPRQESIDEARSRLDAAESAFTTAREELQRIEQLHNQNLASQSQLDSVRNTRDQARAEVGVATANLAALLNGTTVEELEQARAALREAAAAVQHQQLTMQRLIMTAPRAARVESLPFELGETPRPGEPLILLIATDQPPYARVYVPAPLHRELKTDDKITVQVDGHGQHSGRVRYIASEASFTPYYALTEHDADRLSYLVEIDLEDADDLPSGIPVRIATPRLTSNANDE